MSRRQNSQSGTSAQSSRLNNSSSRSSRGNARSNAAAGGPGASVLIPRIGFIACVVGLIIFGLVMLYSASSIYSYNLYGNYTEIFSKQLVFVAIGVVIVLAFAFVAYRARIIFPLCIAALLVSVVLLLYVYFAGNDALGARRWIDLGFTSIQPSEFAKIFVMLVLAHLVDRCKNEGYSWGLIFMMTAACVIPLALIVIEPDLGTTIIAFVGILTVLWLGGVSKRVIGLLVLVVLVFGVIAIMSTGFRQARISSWLDPASDPLGDGYQLLNSYYAFGGGGIFGVGLGLSKQKFSWLPQSENDFIFAILGEELGLIGALTVMLLFVGLVVFALGIARNAPDALGAMIAGSSGVMIGAQAFLNMLCVVGALPTTGKPLPFFSAGGSAIITTMILVGLVVCVSMRSNAASVYDFRREQFTVVSGGNRSAGQNQGSVLSRLPNPAALIAGGIRQRPAASSARSRAAGNSTRLKPVSSEQRAAVHMSAQNNKVVPISRGKAERKAREAEAARKKRTEYHNGSARKQAEAPISMSSLRRNRTKKTGTGGRSA